MSALNPTGWRPEMGAGDDVARSGIRPITSGYWTTTALVWLSSFAINELSSVSTTSSGLSTSSLSPVNRAIVFAVST